MTETTQEPTPDVFKGLPRRIHVGAATFRVVVTHEGDCEYLEGNHGCAVFNDFRIYLSKDVNLQTALNTVQHEVTHCINWVYGVTDDSTEEQFTTQHSNGQIEVWMRNPRLLNWITRSLRAIKKEAARD